VLPLGFDPPVHRCYRDMVDHFFSVAGAETRRPLITQMATELIDGWVDEGEVEFMEAYATPLPARVIATMMGLPLEELPQLKQWSAAWVSPYSGQLTPAEEREAAAQMVEFQHYLHGHIQDRRANPTDDVISHLANTPVKLPDGERPLTDGEVINMIDHLFIGGNETTTFALTSGMWLLMQQPEVEERLRADPSKIRNFVDEVLRVESPTQGMDRHTAIETEIAGVTIPKGAHIHMRYAAANRDPAQYGCPADIDLDRPNGYRHLAFSIGESYCPGAGLSRLEQNISWHLLLDRIENIRLAESGNELTHFTNLTLRSFQELRIVFDKR
jgi:cytochrome P450